MRQFNFSDGDKNYKRIDKRTARRAYDAGLTVHFCPCNLRPFNRYGFGLDMDINKEFYNCDFKPFDYIVNEYEFYNCRDMETGKYTAFYIENKKGV